MVILYKFCSSVILLLRFTPQFFLTKKTINKDLEENSCRIFPNFCYAKTSLNPDVKLNRIFTLETKKSWGRCFAHIVFYFVKEI